MALSEVVLKVIVAAQVDVAIVANGSEERKLAGSRLVVFLRGGHGC